MKRIIMGMGLVIAGSAWGMQGDVRNNLQMIHEHTSRIARVRTLIKFQKDRAHGLFGSNQSTITTHPNLDLKKIDGQIVAYAQQFIEEAKIAEAVLSCVNADMGMSLADVNPLDVEAARVMIKYLRDSNGGHEKVIADLESFVIVLISQLADVATSQSKSDTCVGLTGSASSSYKSSDN